MLLRKLISVLILIKISRPIFSITNEKRHKVNIEIGKKDHSPKLAKLKTNVTGAIVLIGAPILASFYLLSNQ